MTQSPQSEAKYVESWCLNCARREEFDEPLTEEEAFARTDRIGRNLPMPENNPRPPWGSPLEQCVRFPDSMYVTAAEQASARAELAALRAENTRLLKALEDISTEGERDGLSLEEASGGGNFDDTYYEGCDHGWFGAGEMAREALNKEKITVDKPENS